MFSFITTRYELAKHLFGGGMDFWWRGRAFLIAQSWKLARIRRVAACLRAILSGATARFAALAIICVFTLTAATVETPPAVQLVFELFDGSRVIGTPAVGQFKIATKYADLQVPLSGIRSIEFGGADGAVEVSLQNGDHISGKLGATEVSIKAIFGQVVIPLAQVRKIRVAAAGGAMPNGLVLHYTFDTDDGAKVTDSSDSGNDGIVRGATYSKEGKSGGAMSFNGDLQGIITKNAASLQLQDFTIAAWIKRGDKSRVTQHGINMGGIVFAYGQGGYGLIFNSDGQLALTKMGISNVSAASRIQDDNWHHLAVTKTGNKIVFYLDGVAYPAADYNVNFEFVGDIGTGARGDDLQNSFIGLIDEVAVFNRALSEDEVKGIYDSLK